MIISLSGERQVGKDTTGDILVKKYNYKKLAWAEAIRDIIDYSTDLTHFDMLDSYRKDAPFSEWYGKNVFTLDTDIGERMLTRLSELYPETIPEGLLTQMVGSEFNTIRDFMIWFGTDFCRNKIDDEIWVKIVLNQITDDGNFVITDSRFPNERKIIKDMGGVLVRIYRDTGLDGISHKSENSLGCDSDYDTIIYNNCNIASLQTEVAIWHETKFKDIKRV